MYKCFKHQKINVCSENIPSGWLMARGKSSEWSFSAPEIQSSNTAFVIRRPNFWETFCFENT